MRPLKIVSPLDLQVGKQYLIEHIGPSYHSRPKCKGTFLGNILPQHPRQCTLSKFNKIQDGIQTRLNPDYEYRLQDCFYRYYEADALVRAYTMHVLCSITGDPDFNISL